MDINPATVTKLADRGTFQTIGLVTDVEPFLRSLVAGLSSDWSLVIDHWSRGTEVTARISEPAGRNDLRIELFAVSPSLRGEQFGTESTNDQ